MITLPACTSMADQPITLAEISERYNVAAKAMETAPQATMLSARDAAQLRDIRNAEARVWLARSRLDRLGIDPHASRVETFAEVQEFFTAREALRRARAQYGPTETGFDPRGWHPLVLADWGYVLSGPSKIHRVHYRAGSDGLSIKDLNTCTAMPLSGIRR